MLLDRGAEVAELDRVLSSVREGLSGVLVLRGEAGIGKTALLEYAVASAGDMHVARVVGVESEMELSFAALHQLLVPFLGQLEGLPGPQRDALGSAFGLLGGVQPDRFLVGLAALTLLADVAAERPLLCVVDDAQWLDQASAVALTFAARRLFADGIGMLFGVREPAEAPVALDGLPELRIEGLPDPEARELLATVAPARLDRRVGERIVRETQGNPLALVELGRELTPDEFSGAARLSDPLPLGRALEARFLGRVGRLPEDAQKLLLLAAAEPSGDPELLWRAAARVGLGTDTADLPAVDRLLTVAPRVAFRHPLMRSAVYHGASPGARRRAHEALAAASDPQLDPDRQAWHLASAARGPDEEVAAELERSADRTRERGGYAAAASALSRAGELTPDEHRRAVRRLHAAQAELAAGSPAAAAGLLEQAMPRLTGPLERAEARRLEARVRLGLGEVATIPAILLETAQALERLDVSRARETLLDAYQVAYYAGLDSEASTTTIARVARGTPRPPNVPESPASLLLDGIALLDTDYMAAARVLQRATRAFLEDPLPRDEDLRWAGLASRVATELSDDAAALALSARAVKLARDRGALTALLPALAYHMYSLVISGQVEAAEAAFAEQQAITAATGIVAFIGSEDFVRLYLLGWGGDEARTRELAAAATREALERGMGGVIHAVRRQMTVLELALGNYEAALGVARTVYDADPFMTGTLILPDLIEAAVRSDNRAAGAVALKRLSERSLASGTELALGLLARSRALLADDNHAEALYGAAIEHLERAHSAFRLARAHLLYGEWLRRRQRRRDARHELRTAYEYFDTTGATAFAERARIELLATGETARPRTVQTRDRLTPQEAQVARLASEGASNQDIAAQLFVSPNTVAYHLKKVFRKLEVHSRGQLARVLTDETDPQGPPALSTL